MSRSAAPTSRRKTDFFFFWDIEATDKRPTKSCPMSFAGVLAMYVTGIWTEIATFNEFIYTSRPCTPGAFKVHGITPGMIAGKPTLGPTMDMLAAFMRKHVPPELGVIWVAHNGFGFDMPALFTTLIRDEGRDIDEVVEACKIRGFVDSLPLLTRVMNENTLPPEGSVPVHSYKLIQDGCLTPLDDTGYPRRRLGNIYTSHCGGKSLDGAHDALVDARAIFDIFNCANLNCFLNLHKVLDRRLCYRPVGLAMQKLRDKLGIEFSRHEDLIKKTVAVETRRDGKQFYVVSREQDVGIEWACYLCVQIFKPGARHKCD